MEKKQYKRIFLVLCILANLLCTDANVNAGGTAPCEFGQKCSCVTIVEQDILPTPEIDCIDCGEILETSRNMQEGGLSPCFDLHVNTQKCIESNNCYKEKINIFLVGLDSTVEVDVFRVGEKDGLGNYKNGDPTTENSNNRWWYCLADKEKYFEDLTLGESDYWLFTGFKFDVASEKVESNVIGWPVDKDRTSYLSSDDLCIQNAIWHHWVRKRTFERHYELGFRLNDKPNASSEEKLPGSHTVTLYSTMDGRTYRYAGNAYLNGNAFPFFKVWNNNKFGQQKEEFANLRHFVTIAHEATHSWYYSKRRAYFGNDTQIYFKGFPNPRLNEWMANITPYTLPEYYSSHVPPYGKKSHLWPMRSSVECNQNNDCTDTYGETTGCYRASCSYDDECLNGDCIREIAKCSTKTCNIKQCNDNDDCNLGSICNYNYCVPYDPDVKEGIWVTNTDAESESRVKKCDREYFEYDHLKYLTEIGQFYEDYNMNPYLGSKKYRTALSMLQLPWDVLTWPIRNLEYELKEGEFGRNPFTGERVRIYPANFVRDALMSAEKNIALRIYNRINMLDNSIEPVFNDRELDGWFYDGFLNYRNPSWTDDDFKEWQISAKTALNSIGVGSNNTCNGAKGDTVTMVDDKHFGVWDFNGDNFDVRINQEQKLGYVTLSRLLVPPKHFELSIKEVTQNSIEMPLLISETFNDPNVQPKVDKCCLSIECSNIHILPLCTDEHLQLGCGSSNCSNSGYFKIAFEALEVSQYHDLDLKYDSYESIADPNLAKPWVLLKDEFPDLSELKFRIDYHEPFMVLDYAKQKIETSLIDNEQETYNNRTYMRTSEIYKKEYTGIADIKFTGTKNHGSVFSQQDVQFQYCVCPNNVVSNCEVVCDYSIGTLSDECNKCLVNSCSNHCNYNENISFIWWGEVDSNWKYIKTGTNTPDDKQFKCIESNEIIPGVSFCDLRFNGETYIFSWEWYNQIIESVESRRENPIIAIVRASHQEQTEIEEKENKPFYDLTQLMHQCEENHYLYRVPVVAGSVKYEAERLLKPVVLREKGIEYILDIPLNKRLHLKRNWYIDYIPWRYSDIWLDHGFAQHIEEELFNPAGIAMYDTYLNKLTYQGTIETTQETGTDFNHTGYSVDFGFDYEGNSVRFLWGGLHRDNTPEDNIWCGDMECPALADNAIWNVVYDTESEKYIYSTLHTSTDVNDDRTPFGTVGGHVFYYNTSIQSEEELSREQMAQSGKLMIIGGVNSPRPDPLTAMYSIPITSSMEAGNFTKYDDVNYPISYSSRAQIGYNKHLLLGGVEYDEFGKYFTDKIYELNLEGEEPELILLPLVLPEARADASVAYSLKDNRLYLFGGRGYVSNCPIGHDCIFSEGNLDDFYYSDFNEDTEEWGEWIQIDCEDGNDACPSARHAAAMVVNEFNGRVSVFGGVLDEGDNDDFDHIFDPEDGWTDSEFNEFEYGDCRNDLDKRYEFGKMCRNREDHWSNPIGHLVCDEENELICNASTEDTDWTGSYLTVRNQNAFAMGSNDNKVYIGTDWGLDVVYVGLDYAPFRLGWMPTNGAIVDLEVNGDYSYHLDDDGLNVFDLNWDILPRRIGQEGMKTGQGKALENVDSFVYAISDSHLEIFDVSNRKEPKQVAQMEIGSGCNDIAVENGYAYIGGAFGIKVVDIRSTEYLRVVDLLETDLPVSKVRMKDGFLYSSLIDNTQHASKVIYPGHIAQLNNHNIEPWVRGVIFNGNRSYWAKGHWMYIRER